MFTLYRLQTQYIFQLPRHVTSRVTNNSVLYDIFLTWSITLLMRELIAGVKSCDVPWKHQRTIPPLLNIVKKSNILKNVKNVSVYNRKYRCAEVDMNWLWRKISESTDPYVNQTTTREYTLTEMYYSFFTKRNR